MEAVSDDGRQVTVGIHHGDWRRPQSRWESRDARTGADRTPAHWNDPDWQALVPHNWYPGAGFTELLSHPSGQRFLRDEAAWVRLRERLSIGRVKHIEDTRRTGRRVGEDEAEGTPFPPSLRFSPDGQFVAYVTRNGWPVHLVHDSTGDGTVIENVRTGRQIAVLPGVTRDTRIAPGGRTAVSEEWFEERGVERPRLILWDLETSARRAELSLPNPVWHPQYSPDGRYVFAHCLSPYLIRWWDVATGRPVGEIAGAPSYNLVDGGQVLVIQSDDNHLLYLWDVPTGRQLGEWEPSKPPGTSGHLGRLLASGGQHFACEFKPEPDQDSAADHPLTRRLLKHLPDREAAPKPDRVVVLDVTERRVLGPVSGESAALSPNGRWLATLDADGVVRVWPIPLDRPWVRGFGYAVAIVLGGWAVSRLLGRLRGKVPPIPAPPPTASPA
jgi:WD40 repeat protein